MPETIVVQHELLHTFAREILEAASVRGDDGSGVADGLLWADLRGRHGQGVSRLPVFVERVSRGLIASPANMCWSHLSRSCARLDAGNGFGHVAGRKAMEKAIQLAKTHGAGVVTVLNSNHYGAASYYCALAAEKGCLGITCTNAVPKVAPYGGTRPVLGTNPFAFGCPTSSGAPVLVDFSSGALSGSEVREKGERAEPLPEGVALGKDGYSTTDPADIGSGCILPAAGPKGFGLALMVEIMSGILAGAAVAEEVGSLYNTWDRPANTGHLFLALDIKTFLPLERFTTRLEGLLATIKKGGQSSQSIRYPGEIRALFFEGYSRDGIPLPCDTVESLTTLAADLGVRCPWHIGAKLRS